MKEIYIKKLVMLGIILSVILLGVWGIGLVNRGIRLNGNTDFQWNAVC